MHRAITSWQPAHLSSTLSSHPRPAAVSKVTELLQACEGGIEAPLPPGLHHLDDPGHFQPWGQ